MVSFHVGAKSTRRSRSLLINVGSKSTHQHDSCNIYYNKRWLQIDTPRLQPILINVCVNIQMTNRRYSQQWSGLEDTILQLPIVYSDGVRIHNLQLPIVYSVWGLLRHCWTLRRWLEAATGSWWGPQYDGKCSFYFNFYFFRTTPTNWDLREKAIYFPSWMEGFHTNISASMLHTLLPGNW